MTLPDPAMVGKARYPRRDAELYETPEWCTRVLLRTVSFQRVWEPACGRGAISRVLEGERIDVASTDLHDHGYGTPGIDFLTSTDETSRDIVTNPPYDQADAFVRKALELTARHQGYVAMLMRHEWDAGKTRDELLAPGSRFFAKIVLTERPVWFEDVVARPRHNFSWYIWAGIPVDYPKLLRGR